MNTLGVSIPCIDYASEGLSPWHTHPRTAELIFVLCGMLSVGFVIITNKLISKIIAQGDVFAFPWGLVQFQKDMGSEPAVVISIFNS